MVSVYKQFIREGVKRAEIIEFLRKTFRRAGFGGVEIQNTPLGSRVIIEAERPGLVIGRHGLRIREVAKILEEKYGLKDPQIFVNEVSEPELNPMIMAERIAMALERGFHFRRVGNIALRQIMAAGARGAEIVISGKLTSERARFEKFRAGLLPKSGEPYAKYVREATTSVLLKPGVIGIKVRILPPVNLPDDAVRILEEEVEKREKGGGVAVA